MKSSPSASPQPDPAIDVLIESEAWRMLPEAEDIVRRAIAFAATSTVAVQYRNAEVAVLLCDDKMIAGLNARWRGQDRPTNVLSFPAPPRQGASPDGKIPLGDIAIAYQTLAREAGEQGKTVFSHLSHLVVHGFLHLLGYDHHTNCEAERMERLERDILARIGIADPYALRNANI
ncbi:MAG TPA: rRNA maturation RNase YbeY [Xanthobacteraceae bacterium]|nr:rRNA maturation RNase YbeY [Xanthobacteraceae bacterium]